MRLSRAQEDAAAHLDRRIRLIAHRNPAHDGATVRRAAEAEIEAIRTLEEAPSGARLDARIDLRTKQIRSANLDMSVTAARDLARLQIMADGWHWTD